MTHDNMETEMNTVVAVDFRAADEERGHDVLPLDLVEAYLRRFVAYPSEHALVAHVLWIAHAHLILCFDTTPRLAFMSAEKMSGKTRALEVTALFVPYPNLSFNASAAALVRVISKGHEDGKIPTILYDEIDNVFGTQQQQDGAGDLKAALNSGYRRGATAMRCTNHGANVAEYFCFAPLAVAGLRTLPDTLASRAIFIHMRRRAPDEEVESFRLRYHPAEAEPIKMALAEWCQEHEDEIRDMEPAMPFGITDRNADCWEPLLAIADAAGGDWPEQAREAAKYLTGAANEDTITKGVELLQHIKEAFGDKDRLWTSDLINRLCDRPESPWTDVFRGKAINDRGLAVRLTPYGIKSRDVRIGATKHKGYLVTDFHDAWKRYLPECRDSRDSRDIFDNKNNFVAAVASVASDPPETEAACKACDGNYGKGCPTCNPKAYGIGVRR